MLWLAHLRFGTGESGNYGRLTSLMGFSPELYSCKDWELRGHNSVWVYLGERAYVSWLEGKGWGARPRQRKDNSARWEPGHLLS